MAGGSIGSGAKRLAFLLLLLVVALPAVLGAQSSAVWHSAQSDSLVLRAIARRGEQLADSTLLSFEANAHGFLTFLAQLGEGTIIPPRIVQSEELMSRLYWWQPDRSAQRLIGRRDTTLLPSSVGYYRDRYQVILDNLPDLIRLGDGRDVRDVPHPLSAAASARYEYSRGDRLTIRLAGREITVDEIRFRPIDQESSGAVGSVFIDRETGAVARLTMTFTRAAIIDERIETLVITLENMLVNTRYWLPAKQEVEVSRRTTWFELPVRGIVRGRWEISDYTVNERFTQDATLLPHWSSVPSDSLRAFRFEQRIVDVLPPDVRMASPEELSAARTQIESAIRASALARPERTALSGAGISDLMRFSRTEGLALGLGAARRTGGLKTAFSVRYGLADKELKGRATIGRVTALGGEVRSGIFAEREYRSVAPVERSGVANSVFALLFGSDYTSQTDVRAAGLELRKGLSPWRLRIAWEDERPLTVTARPLSGTFSPATAAWSTRGVRAELTGSGGWAAHRSGEFDGEWTLDLEAGASSGEDNLSRPVHPFAAKAHGTLSLVRRGGSDRSVFLRSWVTVAGGRELPPQWLALAGGPWSAPGYGNGSIAARAMFSQRAEYRHPLPAPSIPLGRYGRSPAHVTVAPLVQLLITSDGLIYPSIGFGLLSFYDIIRMDLTRGLRGGVWGLSMDIDRSFWGLL